MIDEFITSETQEALRKQLTTTLSELKNTLQADVVCMFVYDDDTESFHMPIGLGLHDLASFIDPRMHPRGDRGAAKLIIQDRILIAEQIEEQNELNAAFAHRERIRSMAGVACKFQETIVGVIYVNYRSPHIFDEKELTRLREYAAQFAEQIANSLILQDLPNASVETISPEDKTLKNIVELACHYSQSPIGIWLVDSKDKNCLRIRVASGLPVHYRDDAACYIDDPCMISQVFKTGHYQVIADIQQDEHFPFKEIAADADWVSAFGYPITSMDKPIGVLESFTFKPWKHDKGLISAHRQLAELVGLTFENSRRSEEAERLSALARKMSASADLEESLELIVRTARELTGADSSSIFLYDKRTRRCNKEMRDPPSLPKPDELPREKGLTSYIIETGETVHIRDSKKDELADKMRDVERAKSLIGVCLDIGQEGIGVLYVRGLRPHQFIQADEALLTAIAAQAALTLSLGRFLLKPISQIEAAAAKQFEQEGLLKQICQETKALGFDFAAIQLIRPEEQIIETVYTNAQKDWAGIAKHSLEADSTINDIQAEIALANPPCIKIITGWDERFDRWIFEQFDHQHYTRVWVPIVLVRDGMGVVMDDWFEMWTNAEEPLPVEEVNNEEKGRHIYIPMPLPEINLAAGHKAEIIGTLEAGYYDPKASLAELHQRISIEQSIALAKLVAKFALELRKTQLLFVLETIADCAWEIIRADSASLHFIYNQKLNKYTYEVCMGELKKPREVCQPRENGLGQRAIQSRDVQVVPNVKQGHGEEHLKISNPAVWEMGVRAMAAVPLLVDEKKNERIGVLYVLYSKPHWFTKDEIGWVKHFANRAVEAIRNSLNYALARDNAKALSVLHSISQSLATKPQDPLLLRQIAGNSVGLLAADVVNIYEYAQTENRFLLPHESAGKLLVDNKKNREIERHSGPYLLLASKEDFHFTNDSLNHPIMNSPELDRTEIGSFVERENIKSSAGIKLRVDTQIVGVMFINFRRRHQFTDLEIQIIKTLAANVALAIINRRLFDTLTAGSREILTTLDLDKLLSLIVRRAALITGGDVAHILLVEGTAANELIAHARYPEIEPICESMKRLKLGEGAIGMVALQRTARIIADTERELGYKPYFEGLRSTLYVPLLTGERRLLGILATGSRTVSKFNQRDQMMLEALADQAVIALQNASNQRQLAASETMAALGDIAGNLLHRINNDVGAIRINATTLMEELEGENETIAKDIIELSNQILDEAGKLIKSIPDRFQGVDAVKALSFALKKLRIAKNIEVIYEPLDYLPTIKGSETQIQNIFVNLLQNAIDAMPTGGTLTIHSEIIKHESKHMVNLHITDTGIGIPSDQIDNIFSGIYSTKGSRHGFGLWWNKNYIKRLGGAIHVKSIVGQGTCFTVSLPEWEGKETSYGHNGEIL